MSETPITPPMPPMPEEVGASFEEALAAAMGHVPAAAKGPTADEVLAAASDPVVPPPAAADPVAAAPAPAAPAKPEPIPQALLDREAALEVREKTTRAAEDRVKALEAREAKMAQAAAGLEADPVGYIRALRPDLTQAQAAKIAERLYMHALGDQAPVEARVTAQVSEAQRATEAQLAEVRAQLEATRAEIQAAQNEAKRAAYMGQLAASAAALDAAAHPILANIAKRNPEKYSELLFSEAVRAAQESQAAGKDAAVLTAVEAAARVEAALKAHRDELYGPATESANAQQSAPSQTLSNQDSRVQPNRTPPDSMDDKVLRAAALKAAGLGHLQVWD